MFRAQLLREDIARLHKLESLLQTAPNFEAFKHAGMRLGWTQGDARTHELREPLEALLGALFQREEAAITVAWNDLYRTRMERLLGCLSTPVPRPVD